ncbi:NUDIX domain-containing protein [Lapillicoccus sp.]|uniref:NUDIX domain-containing protein n=1 Tax=Lapillicoccus sp. TaxID=1909287 RepID=UPI003983B447
MTPRIVVDKVLSATSSATAGCWSSATSTWWEDVATAALREAWEETGLTAYRVVRWRAGRPAT